jgi:hypothetical protein
MDLLIAALPWPPASTLHLHCAPYIPLGLP